MYSRARWQLLMNVAKTQHQARNSSFGNGCAWRLTAVHHKRLQEGLGCS